MNKKGQKLCLRMYKSRFKEGFGAVDFEPAPGSQSSKYSRFVNKLFSNVPRVIKKNICFH